MEQKSTEIVPEVVSTDFPEERVLSLTELIYQERLLQARNMEVAWQFYDWKAKEESKKLSKVSRWIISAWELCKLIAGLRDGQFICVNNQGKLFKGYVNVDKMQELPQMLPKGIPSNLDLAQHTYQKMVTKSVAEPAVVAGFKPQWDSTVRKANRNSTAANGILYFFMEIWEKTMKETPEKCRLEVKHGKLGDKRTVASIEGISTKIVCNTYGNFVGFYYDGKYTKVW